MSSFEAFAFDPLVKKAISEMGFERPSTIQEKALPILLGEPTDFIGLAATGTGKTAAFGIPLLERIEKTKKGVQGLILCPTRELALQVAGQIDLLGKFLGVRSVAIYGGSSYSDQIHGLRHGAAIVVGTPGRLVDHLGRGTLDLSGVRTVILDEADEMISMGFKDDLETILKASSKESNNVWLFSATMSPEVRRVADKYLKNSKVIQANRTEVLSSTVEQFFYATREANKPEILCKIIDAAHDFYGIVFCQTKALVVDLTSYLSKHGYQADCLHGDRDQRSREHTIKAFRNRAVTVLVCTDVASRGLDVKDVTHVINYSIPRELELYVHRIGRTARSGKAGIAMSLVTPPQRYLIPRLEQITKSKIKEGILPTRKDIGVKMISSTLERFKGQQNFERVQILLDEKWKETLSKMSVEEVASRFLAMNHSEVFDDKEREKITLGSPSARPDRKERQERRDSRGHKDHKARWKNSRYSKRRH